MNFELKIADFALALNAVKHAAATKDIRYYLNGIRIEVSDVHALFVATDGHRLATCKTYLAGTVPAPEAFELVIDSDQIPLLCGWLKQFAKMVEGTVSVTYERVSEGGELQPDGSRTVEYALPGNLTFGCAGSVWLCRARPHDEKYPDWRRVMANPDSFKNPTHDGAFNGEYLADVAKVGKLFNGKYAGVKVKLDTGLALFECTNSEGVEFRETLMGMRV